MTISFVAITSLINETFGSPITLLVLSASLVVLFYFWINSRPTEHEIFAERNVKHTSFGNLFILTLQKKRFEHFRHEIITREGNVLGAVQLGAPTIFMNEPELAQQVLSKHFTSFTNRRIIKMIDPVFPHTLFIIEGEKWKRCRSIMTPTFTISKLRMMKPILNKTVRSLIENLNNAVEKNPNGTVEVKHICGAYTMDTIVQISFGVEIDSLIDSNNPLLKHAKSIFQVDFSLYNTMILLLNVTMPFVVRALDLRMNRDAIDYFSHLSCDIIRNKRESLKNSNNLNNNGVEQSRPTNFIELLLEAENERLKLESEEYEVNDSENGQKTSKAIKFMSDQEILAQSVLFLMVGYDTTATTITLTLYHLALYPQFQERLFNEIMETQKQLQTEQDFDVDPVQLFSFEAIQKMKFIEAVIKETLRLFPPAFFSERRASEDVQLENGSKPISIKKGDVINFPIYTMHRDPRYWTNPEEFNPDRFLDSNPTYHKYSYLPFGAGPRDCIAKSLAYLEAKMAILHAVRLYKFSRSSETKVPVEFYFQANLLVSRNVYLHVEKR